MFRELQIGFCGRSVWLVGRGSERVERALQAVGGGWVFPAACEEPQKVLRNRII